MQTDATTPNNIGICSAPWEGYNPEDFGDHVRPDNVGRAEQTDPTLLRYASAITEQKKCWELLAQTFD